jgi:hypothetical protein
MQSSQAISAFDRDALRYDGDMRKPLRLLCITLLGLTACSSGEKPQAIRELPPMSRNCEWLQERFEQFVAERNFCAGLTPHELLATEPKLGGARLDSVASDIVKIRGTEEEYFQYKMIFSTRTIAFPMTMVSRKHIEFQTGKFYAVDLYNVCRFETVSAQDAPTPKLLESFVMPNKLSCI